MDNDSPAKGFAITPHDTNALAHPTRGIYVGVTGDITLVTAGGDQLLLKNVAAGMILPIRAVRVLATGTTADMYLVGLY